MKEAGIVYDFGHFRLMPGERVLYCGGKPLALTPKAVEVLCLLVKNSGHVVEKNEFMRVVWSDAAVEDGNLAQTIFTLRKILGETHRDHHSHEYIETVARRGYRFIAPVRTGVGQTISLDVTSPVPSDSVTPPKSAQKGLAENVFDEETVRFYVRGTHYLKKHTVGSLKKGIESFEQCLKRQPEFALAYLGLADCYYRLSNICLPPVEVVPKAKAALATAMKFDPTLSNGHALLGVILAFYDRDWPKAEIEFEQALTLGPDDAHIRQRFGLCLGLMGRFDDGIAEMRRALQLNPQSRQIRIGLGTILHLARQHGEAMRQAHGALDLDPDSYAARILLGVSYIQLQRPTEACAEFEVAVHLDNEPRSLGYLGYGYGVSGKHEEALRILNILETRAMHSYVSPFAFTLAHAGLRHTSRTIEWAERALEDRNEMFSFIENGAEFDFLRAEERFIRLLNRRQFIGSHQKRARGAHGWRTQTHDA